MKQQPEQIENSFEAVHPQFLPVGDGASQRRIAFLQRTAERPDARVPGIVWLGGFRSDMESVKASALDQWAADQHRSCLRFDYSGHGRSDGRFEDATIGSWLEESITVIRTLTTEPQILVGSSMGGWLALLCARAFAQMGETRRLHGLVLIAPATDFTEALVFDRLSPEAHEQLERDGVWMRPSAYSDGPYPITRKLIEEGRQHLIFGDTIRTHCPVHILHGMRDEDVPWRHSIKLVEHLAADPVILTLVKDGEHRLSRPEDLRCLQQAIKTML